MSYTIFVQKFDQGESTSFDREELESIVARHGRISKEEFGYEILTPKNLGENIDLNVENENDISGLSINRPVHCIELKSLIFDVLEVEGTCFFDQNLSYLQTRSTNKEHFPGDLIGNLESGITIVNSVDEIWPTEK